MFEIYRYGLNRFLPAMFVGDALMIPSRTVPGKFDIVPDGKRFVPDTALDTPPIAKLVEPQGDLPWNAPTVLLEPRSRRRSTSTAFSDYRYLQGVARQRAILPVLNHETGRIHNLALVLRPIELLDYTQLVSIAARRSRTADLPGMNSEPNRQTARYSM